jgi:hypothetical protein
LRRFFIGILGILWGPVWLFPGTFVTAKYGGAFLSGGVGARSSGMGNAQAAAVDDASALYWNPACLVMLDKIEIQGMHAERFSGLVDADYIGIGLPLGDKTALGAGFYRLAVDGIPVTTLVDPSLPLGALIWDGENRVVQNAPTISGTINDQEMAFFFSYSRRQNSFWNWGVGMKMLHKQVGGNSAWGLGFDAGVMLFPYRDLRLGFLLQDATTTLLAWNGKRKERILPRFRTGLCYPVRIGSSISFVPAVDAEANLESPERKTGSLNFDLHTGLELELFKRIFFRSGMQKDGWSVGAGVAFSVVRVDYAFIPNKELGTSQRISTSIRFDARTSE